MDGFRVTLGTGWIFENTLILYWVLMVLRSCGVNLRVLWSDFEVTLHVLWVYDCGFGLLLGDFGVTLGSLWASDGGLGES